MAALQSGLVERPDPLVRVLGPIQLGQARVPVTGQKASGTLALLCISQGRPVSAYSIADVLWADAPPPTAETALRVHVSRLRRLGEQAGVPALIARSPIGYGLGVGAAAVDAVEFETLVGNARGQSAGEAVDTLRAALTLWSGEPYAGAPDHERVNVERRRLSELRLSALEDRCANRLAIEEPGAIVDELLSLVDSEPFRERRADLAARALYGAGRQAEALRLLARTRAQLRDEVGLNPSPALRELESRILAHDPHLLPAHPRTRPTWHRRVPPASPPLVGRDEVLARLMIPASTPDSPLVRVLIGAPGMGKTRLLAEYAAAADGVAFYGACAAGVPLRPVLQMLLNALAHGRLDPAELPAALSRLLVAGTEVHRGLETSVLAFAAGDAIETMAATGRVVLLVDDAQALDEASELAMRAILDSGAPVEFVFAAWPSELGASGAWTRLQSQWPANCDVKSVALAPLTRIELIELAAAAGLASPADGALRLSTVSAGNPFVALTALRTGSIAWNHSTATPDDVLAQFLTDQTADELELLQLVALSGEGCPIDVVRELRGGTGVQRLWSLEGRHMIAVVDHLARVAHDLLHNAIARRTGAGHRKALSAELAAAERTTRSPGWRHRWALHALDAESVDLRDADGFVTAAREAVAGGRFDVASNVANRWLEAVPGADDAAGHDMRCVLAVALGRGGDLTRAISILDAVEREAAAHGDLERRIAAAVCVGEFDRMVMAGGDPVPLLDRVLGDVPADRIDDRVQLSALLLLHLSSPNRRATNVGLARQLVATEYPKDPRVQLQALAVQHRILAQRPAVSARAEVADRVTLMADAFGGERARFQGLLMAVANALRSGDHDAAELHRRRLVTLVERSHDPIWRWHGLLVTACIQELAEPGSGDEAAADAARLGRRYGIPDGDEAAAVWAFVRAYDNRTLASFGPLAQSAAERAGNPAWSAGAALSLAESDVETAAAFLTTAWDTRDGLFGTGIWLVHCCVCLEAAARLEDSRVRNEAFAVVTPFSGQWAVLGSASSCFGPVDRFLALAAGGPKREHLLANARAQAARAASGTWLDIIDHDARGRP